MDILKHIETIITSLTLLIVGAGVIFGWLAGKRLSLEELKLPEVPIKVSAATEARLDRIEQTLISIEKNTRPDGAGKPLLAGNSQQEEEKGPSFG